MKTVKCCECGKSFEVIESKNIHIPKYRCDECLEKIKP